MLNRIFQSAAVAAGMVFMGASSGIAGQPEPWQLGFQKAASPTMEMLTDVHNLLLFIITVITLFVLALLVIVIVKFNEKANPKPSKTAHNTLLEIIWTAVPVLILVVIAVPSFRLLFFADQTQEADLTLKITGHQWYWSYEYPDHGGIAFDSFMVPDEELKPGQPRLLAVDNEVVLPVGKNVRLLMTSADVIHNWAMPSMGIKLDTVPGRVNETWVRINEPGDYYGQCSELCGVNHGFMPIHIRAVTDQEFAAWVEQAKEQFASHEGDGPQQAETMRVAVNR